MNNQNLKNRNDYSSIRRVFSKNGQNLKSLTLCIKLDIETHKFLIFVKGLNNSEEFLKTVMCQKVKERRNRLNILISESFTKDVLVVGFKSKYPVLNYFNSIEEAEIVASSWLKSYRAFLDTGKFFSFKEINKKIDLTARPKEDIRCLESGC